jgi:prepilin-type N-terminal cleavage/methylation domain-containing protein
MKRRTKGFTLIELLVVISIIALLIGILLPALGEAKRKARQLIDVANLSTHGKAIGIYSSQNNGRMPNIRPGNGLSTGASTGPRNLPMITWANAVGGVGGNTPDQGSPLAYNGWAFGAGGLSYDDLWRFHNLAFGDYIVDEGGLGLLNDVFASPGSTTSGNWDVIRSGTSPDAQFGINFIGLSAGNTGAWYTGGQYGAAGDTAAGSNDEIITWALQSDYKYTFAGLYGQNTLLIGGGSSQTFWDAGNDGFGGSTNLPWLSGGSFWRYRAYVQASAFDHPAAKVAFWEHWAVNSRRANIYFMPFANISVATIDGSARIVNPFDDMPDLQQNVDAYKRGQGWGTQQNYQPASGHDTAVASQQLGLPGGNPKPYAWFIYTDKGPRGRDLSGDSSN